MEENLKILVVDDDQTNGSIVSLALTQTAISMEIDEVKDGNHAFFALINNHYDCVFFNYHLPNQDSFTLIHKLQSSGIKVPLVILIDSDNEQIARELLKLGASEYFVKSTLSPETIAQILRITIRIHHAEMRLDLANQQLKESREQLVLQQKELTAQQQHIKYQNFKLLEISSFKSLFLATISHELRTPMNAIIGFSQILLRPKFGQLTNQQLDMVEKILNNGKDLLLKINEILDFSQLESGKLELKPEILDLSKVVSHAVTKIRPLAESKNLSLLVKIDLENTLVFNDAVRLQQIVINLLSNAVKFTESGSIWVEIQETTQNQVIITVKDTGIGIASQDIQKIFGAFHQIDQGIGRKYSGTGLGLAIIDSLVDMMGGKIDIESQLGVGSIFKIKLPRKINLAPDLESVVFSPHQNPFHSVYSPHKASINYPHLKF
ncbi:ATP-binding response regulator [Dolichospermum compactum]|uniref:Circadian input-output histidine kinase CikA n=1 Tax=Dolichospermum compactum NIES-806 TaxID=1973481 RepID=A0A1Z4V9D1_9CYAN|nr:ATP-binding protein [Dolichospermum compactum]BAZ88180.1 response regulator receiver sensor signal transduction histidine kinase [Dolichospermum compactum NIES-806]